MALGAALYLVALDSQARPGTHANATSTWDTRASSIVLEGQPGFLDGGHFHSFGYNANFSSTSGNLSSQFGIHYLNVRTAPGEAVMHGLAASASGLYTVPVLPRFENGIPKLALGFYVGSVPTALIAGQRNDFTLPLAFGLGLPASPAQWITLTPWIEISPSLNLDTKISPYKFDQIPTDGTLPPSSVSQILEKSVSIEAAFAVGARAGLRTAFHLGDGADFDVSSAFFALGKAFDGPLVVQIGGALVFRWDKIVPAVLPAGRRLQYESCEDVAARQRACQLIQGTQSPQFPELPASAPGAVTPPAPPATDPAFATPPGAPPATAPLPAPQSAPFPAPPGVQPAPPLPPPDTRPPPLPQPPTKSFPELR